METITITEALAEIKLAQKKIDKKKIAIGTALTRYDKTPDPHGGEGGSKAFVKAELQSIGDIYDRLVRIRAAISTINSSTMLLVEGVTKTIGEWLVWKREVCDAQLAIYTTIRDAVNQDIQKITKQPQLFTDDKTGERLLVKLEVNIDLTEHNQKMEKIMTIKERLDGLLSLKNAITSIAF